MSDRVILVTPDDNEVGTAERHSVHQEGALHRAVSVFVLNDSGELLLQRRAGAKTTFPGRWGNTCCTHPRPGEEVEAAGQRRLEEEMGMVVDLQTLGWFIYRAEDEASGYVEHELDHVLVGRSNGNPSINPDEVAGHSWIDLATLRREASDPRYVPWLVPALDAFPQLI